MWILYCTSAEAKGEGEGGRGGGRGEGERGRYHTETKPRRRSECLRKTAINYAIEGGRGKEEGGKIKLVLAENPSGYCRLETYLIPGEMLIPGGKRFTLVLDMPQTSAIGEYLKTALNS